MAVQLLVAGDFWFINTIADSTPVREVVIATRNFQSGAVDWSFEFADGRLRV